MAEGSLYLRLESSALEQSTAFGEEDGVRAWNTVSPVDYPTLVVAKVAVTTDLTTGTCMDCERLFTVF